MARNINNSWQAAVPPTGRTITNYSLENNGSEVVEVGNVLVANGVTINDDLAINTRVRAKYDDNSYGPYSNVETIAAAANLYDPETEGALLALEDNVALAQDVSGNDNHSVAVATFGQPTNSGGLNAYVASESDLTRLTTPLVILTDGDFTRIFKVMFPTLTLPSSTTPIMQSGGTVTDAFGVTASGNIYCNIGAQAITNAPTFSSVFMAGVARTVTLKRASNVVTLQFDDDTPLVVTPNTSPNASYTIDYTGGSNTLSRFMNFSKGRELIFGSSLTGQSLIDAKAYVTH